MALRQTFGLRIDSGFLIVSFHMADSKYMVLATEWEGRKCLRARARENGLLTMWPKPEQIGVATSPACALNAVPLTLLAEWWAPQCAEPQTVPIGPLRAEVLGF